MATFEEVVTATAIGIDTTAPATQKNFPEENILLRYRFDQRSGDWMYPDSTAKDLSLFGGASALALRMSGGLNGNTTWIEQDAAVGEFYAGIGTIHTASSYILGLTGSVLDCSGFSAMHHRQQELFDAYAPASFSMWAKADWPALFLRSTGANTTVVLFHHGPVTLSSGLATDANSGRFSVVIHNNALVLSYVYTTVPTSAGTAYTISASLATSGLHSGWNNIVATFAPGRVALYVNGAEVGALSHSPSRYFRTGVTTAYGYSYGVATTYYNSTGSIYVYPATGFVGAMDESVLWNKALTPAEVLGVYTSPQYSPYLYAGMTVNEIATYGMQDFIEAIESFLAGTALTGDIVATLQERLDLVSGLGFVHGAAASEVCYEWASERADFVGATSALYKFFASLLAGITTAEALTDQQQFSNLIGEAVTLYASLAYIDSPTLTERCSLAENLSAGASVYNVTAPETIRAVDAIIASWLLSLTAEVTMGSTAEWRGRHLLALAERLYLADPTGSSHRANLLAVTMMALAEVALAGKGAAAGDTIELAAEVLQRIVGGLALLERLEMATVPENTLRVLPVTTERLAVAATPDTSAVMRSALQEGVAFYLTFGLGGQTYTGWAMDTKSFAVSEYQGYPFNSMCYAHGTYFGANENGVYELTGSTDAGTEISARLRLGVTDFNLPQRKIIDSVYLGFRSDGTMLLRTISDGNVEVTYTLVRTEGVLHRRRVHPMAKGLKSVYWQFELENVDGSDFELSAIEFFPVVMKRTV